MYVHRRQICIIGANDCFSESHLGLLCIPGFHCYDTAWFVSSVTTLFDRLTGVYGYQLAKVIIELGL